MKMLNLLLATSAMLCAVPAAAEFTTYSNAGAFNAAVTDATTETFGTSAGSTYVGATAYARPGMTITASGNYLFNNNPSVTSYYYNWGTGNVLTSGANNIVTITFNQAVTAFGLNLSTFQDDGLPGTPAGQPSTVYGYNVQVGTAQGNSLVSTFANPTWAFFGATSDVAFSSITLSSPGAFFNFDNVTLATANVVSAVPEPATWAMMIGGFGVVGGSMRRRRKETLRLA